MPRQHSTVLDKLQKKAEPQNIDVHISSTDLEKTLDSVPRVKLWQAMERLNMKKKRIEVVQKI